MSHTKLKVQFRPRKISASKSKQKFSPYRSKQKKSECDEIFQENKQKMALNEPFIRFKRHIQFNPGKTKLKLTQDEHKNSAQPNAQTNTNDLNTASTSVNICSNCELLLQKIEQQTLLLKQNLKEIYDNLKQPKLVKSQHEPTDNMDLELYVQNQKTIIGYLDQIKNRTEEVAYLKTNMNALERQIAFLNKELSEREIKIKQLQMEVGILNSLIADRQKYFKATSDSKETQDAATSSRSVKKPDDFKKEEAKQSELNYKQELKSIMTDIMERHSFDFKKVMNELQQIKLQNDMLREQVKLLTYAMEQKDGKINQLKNEIIVFIQASNKFYKKSSVKSAKSSYKQSCKKSRKVQMKSMQVSIQCIDSSQNKDFTMTQKNSSSFRVKPKNNNLVFQNVKSDIDDDRSSEQNDTQYFNMIRGKTVPLNHSISFIKRKQMQEDKLTMAKPFLRLNKKESVITKHQRQQLQRQRNEIMYFSQSKLRVLDLIRRTLEHRLKGFKFNFQQLQTQMLAGESYLIEYKQMDEILTEYPFSLERRLRQVTLEYILRDSSTKHNKSIPRDLLCNRLRQLMADFEDTQQEQEFLLVQKLKKKIYLYFDGLLTQCLEIEDRRGLVSQQNLKRVLQQFKFSALQIEVFINQCILLSIDADHLNYKQYLSIFST